MSEDNPDDSRSVSRRNALLTAGSLGAVALAVPGAAAATSDVSKTDGSLTIHDGGAETYKYVGPDANATPRLTGDATYSADIVCLDLVLEKYCLTIETTVNDDSVLVELTVAGQAIAGATLTEDDPDFSGSYDGTPSVDFDINADFSGFDIEISAYAQVCAAGKCASNSVTLP